MWDITIHPPWESDALVGTLAPHGRVALIPFTSQDPFRRNTILSALGPPALTVLFPAVREQIPSRNFKTWTFLDILPNLYLLLHIGLGLDLSFHGLGFMDQLL
ncbi:hypothetical protein ACLB2K_040545 [Fragaria x ananassa]